MLDEAWHRFLCTCLQQRFAHSFLGQHLVFSTPQQTGRTSYLGTAALAPRQLLLRSNQPFSRKEPSCQDSKTVRVGNLCHTMDRWFSGCAAVDLCQSCFSCFSGLVTSQGVARSYRIFHEFSRRCKLCSSLQLLVWLKQDIWTRYDQTVEFSFESSPMHELAYLHRQA